MAKATRARYRSHEKMLVKVPFGASLSFEVNNMRNEVIEKLAALVTIAFGLVAAMAWNSTIQSAFVVFFGTAQTILANIIYAVLVTVIAVVVTIWVGRVAEKVKKKK